MADSGLSDAENVLAPGIALGGGDVELVDVEPGVVDQGEVLGARLEQRGAGEENEDREEYEGTQLQHRDSSH